MTIEDIFSQCEAEGIKLSVGPAGTLDFYCSKKEISVELKEKLQSNKLEIIKVLEQKHPSSPSGIEYKIEIVEPSNGGKQPMSGLSVASMGIYEKVNYIDSLIENTTVPATIGLSTYTTPPFSSSHFYEKNTPKGTDNTDIGSFQPTIIYRNPKKVSLAFEQAKIALPEYKDYIEVQTLLQEDPTDKKLHEASVSKWNLYVRAYESLPEYKALLAVQRQLGVNPQPLSAVNSLEGQSVSKPIIDSSLTHDGFKQVLNYLIHRPVPSNFSKDKWENFIIALTPLLADDCPHIHEFIKHQYSLHEVFGCHPVKPYERYDYRGFILALNPYLRIHEVREDKVIFETVKGHAIQTSSRKVQSPSNWITLMDLT